MGSLSTAAETPSGVAQARFPGPGDGCPWIDPQLAGLVREAVA
jgi:hypothetical protein